MRTVTVTLCLALLFMVFQYHSLKEEAIYTVSLQDNTITNQNYTMRFLTESSYFMGCVANSGKKKEQKFAICRKLAVEWRNEVWPTKEKKDAH